MKTNNRVRAIAGAIVILAAASAQATENGASSTPSGLYTFGAGFMPPATPKGAFGLRTAYYTTDTLKDDSGDDVPVDFSLNVVSVAIAHLRMTQTEMLGARYGWGMVLPLVQMDASLDIATPGGTISDSANVFRQGDIQVTPLILQWNPQPNLGVTAQFQIQVPVGDYDEDRLVSPGLNRWTFSPILNATYLSSSGFEVSSSFELDFNTRNPDTDYLSGVEYRHDFAVGQHIQSWTLGLGGYYYQQLTDDDAPSLNTGNRGRTVAVGPALSFFRPGLPGVWLHAYKEFGARNRSEGSTVALRIAQSF